jgi:lysophospholipase L1-like esterase
MGSMSTVPPSRFQRFAGNLVLAFASIAVFLVLVEAGSRLAYWIRWDRHLYPLQSMQYSLRLGWTMIPGQYRDFHVTRNGFRREGEVSRHQPADGLRVFLVGGSTAFGSNGLYPQMPSRPLREKTIDHYLEEFLRDVYPHRAVEVINAGVPEYRLFQETTLYREKLLAFEPDVVVFLDGHNDISFLTAHSDSLAAPYWNARHIRRGEAALNARSFAGLLKFADLFLGRRSYAYHGLSMLLQVAADRGAGAGGMGNSNWGTRAFRPADEPVLAARFAAELDSSYSPYAELVADLKAIAGNRRGKVVYALQPELVDEDSTLLTDRERMIQRFAFAHHRDRGTFTWRHLGRVLPTAFAPLASRDFAVVDLSRIARGDGQDVYTDYAHLTAAGNRRVAEQLLPALLAVLDQPIPADVAFGTDCSPLSASNAMNRASCRSGSRNGWMGMWKRTGDLEMTDSARSSIAASTLPRAVFTAARNIASTGMPSALMRSTRSRISIDASVLPARPSDSRGHTGN